MPYDNKSTTQPEADTGITRKRYHRDSANAAFTFDDVSTLVLPAKHTTAYRSRSGGLSTKALLRGASLLDGKVTSYVLVSKQVHGGPRLPYHFLNPKTGKLQWARELITVYRLKKRRIRIPWAVAGLDLPPQNLNYSMYKVTSMPVNSLYVPVLRKSSMNSFYDYMYTYEGSLWQSFTPYLGSALPIVEGALLSPITISDYQSVIDDLSTRSLAKLYENAKNMRVNLMVAIGESSQTAAMISMAISRLASGLSALKKGNLSGAARKLFPRSGKALANDYLIWTYGVKPLLGDIQGAAESLAVSEPIQFDVKASRRKVIRSSSTLPHSASITGYTEFNSEVEITVLYKSRCVISDTIGRSLQRMGFDLDGLNSLGWEITPWSFVVDWFVPISRYLASRSAFSNLTLSNCHKTVFIKKKVSMIRRFGGTVTYSNSTYYCPDIETEPVKVESISCVRTVLTTVPPLPFPSFKNPVSSGHLANAAALLIQKLR